MDDNKEEVEDDTAEEDVDDDNDENRGPTEDIIHYFTLMSSDLHYLDIIPNIENLH